MGRIFSIMLLGLVLISCDKNETIPAGISGEVKDEMSNGLIAGADIVIDGLGNSTQSAADGSFSFTGIPAGTYILLISKTGYADLNMLITVFDGQTTEAIIMLSKNLPSFSPTEVNLNYNKQTETVEVENTGGAQLTLNFIPSQSWINVDQSSMLFGPFEKKDLIITADLSSLDYGVYEEEVEVIFDGILLTIPVMVNHFEQADIIWKNWYLSVPINNGEGKATSIFYEDIINDNLTPEEREYFYYDGTSGSYVMWTKFTGYTTSGYYELDGDAYCRTELREFWQGNQTTSDNWYMNVGETHVLESTLNVDYVEGSRGRTFIAQIHGKTSTIPGIDNGPATVKVLWEKGEIEVEYYVKPPNPEGEWTSDYNAKSERVRVDNEVFTIKLKVVDGVLSWALKCEQKGIDRDYVELFDYSTNGYHYDNYFKTGNYFQWKSDYVSTSQVRLYNALTHHE